MFTTLLSYFFDSLQRKCRFAKEKRRPMNFTIKIKSLQFMLEHSECMAFTDI